MTSERFKAELDRVDSGLSDHPDTATYVREGRAARRRRHRVIGLGAGALVAAALTPVFVWGSGTPTSSPTGEVASDPASSASSEPTRTPTSESFPVDQSFGDGMTAAVTEVFPGAEFRKSMIGDHYESAIEGSFQFQEPTLSSPPDWANVFVWNQDYTIEGLQVLDVRTSWDTVPAEVSGCDRGLVARDCSMTESNGYTVVVHDGVRVEGEAVGDWSRVVMVVGPPSADGGTQHAEVWAQVGGMTWTEASVALPSAADLAALAQDERLRLPKPTQIPTP